MLLKEKKYEVEKLSVGRKKLYPSFKNELRIAKQDFTLIERGYQATLKGLLAVEDKIINSKGFPQIIAEGIAVAQQKDWNLNWPVYMIYYCGLEIKIFKA